ncbi:DUF2087 domain-containing protein [Microvirga pudoricolor]|uniref:DUF2087 domain-containing protein n=1 Tax=Microvirga pudoricolor TaxID=2778729 RepID=UPI001951261F|nr:DUF2087 domain-containing protein [Microvirga pudoricolor]MBM6592691.1 DUF2087 domain-containing protein [Microvirga pudoricolor]
MSRTVLPFQANDISSVARSLKDQLAKRTSSPDRPPGHVELLNMLARSTGYRNFQHYRAEHMVPGTMDAPAPQPRPGGNADGKPAVGTERIERLLRCYDSTGLLVRWPPKHTQRLLVLWGLWSRFPARQDWSEAEVNGRLRALHAFDDPALLRRLLCDNGLLERTRDGRVYRRVEQPVPDEASAFLRRLKTLPPAA